MSLMAADESNAGVKLFLEYLLSQDPAKVTAATNTLTDFIKMFRRERISQTGNGVETPIVVTENVPVFLSDLSDGNIQTVLRNRITFLLWLESIGVVKPNENVLLLDENSNEVDKAVTTALNALILLPADLRIRVASDMLHFLAGYTEPPAMQMLQECCRALDLFLVNGALPYWHAPSSLQKTFEKTLRETAQSMLRAADALNIAVSIESTQAPEEKASEPERPEELCRDVPSDVRQHDDGSVSTD